MEITTQCGVMNIQKIISGISFIIVSFVAIQQMSVAKAQASKKPLESQIHSCSIKVEDLDRLACFDILAKAVSAEMELNKKAAASLPKELGGIKFDKNRKEPTANNGQLVNCKKSHDGRWLFYFESGQVWKQISADNVSRRYKGCSYKVAIKKDGFGYKMHIDELLRKIRVKRLK